MKKLKILILLVSVCSFAMAQQSDEALITKTINDFLEGGTNGEVARFKGAFFNDAIQKSVGKNGVSGMTVEQLATKINPNQKMDRTTKLISWSYAGTAGTAITETDYGTSKIVDLLNLLKVNDEWKIISRVYSRIEKDEDVVSSSPSVSKSSSVAKTKAVPVVKPKKAVADDGW